MAIFYIDPASGNDASAGTSWGTAWKTMSSGATQARIAPGDEIRIAKSADPDNIGVNITYTQYSSTATLASSVSAEITDCDTAWTASANVTATASTIRTEGTNAASLAIAAGFTTGKVAYFDLGSSIDFSAYNKITLYIRANAYFSGTALSLRLCSDAIGDTAVNTIDLPVLQTTNQYYPIVLDNGGALGSSIRSVSLFANSDPGTVTLILDNILACNTLSLNSILIGADNVAYPILSMVGTTIALAGYNPAAPTSTIEYMGSSGTVPCIAQNSFYYPTLTESVNDSGTYILPISFIAGYNTGTNIVDGMTWFDCTSSTSNGLTCSKSNIFIKNIGLVRCMSSALQFTASIPNGHNINLENIKVSGALSGGTFALAYSITLKDVYICSTTNFLNLSLVRDLKINDCVVTSAVNYTGATGIINNSKFQRIGGVPVTISQAYNLLFNSCVFRRSTGTLVDNGNQSSYNVVFRNCLVSPAPTEANIMGVNRSTIMDETGQAVIFEKFQQTSNDHRLFHNVYMVRSETSVRHTASGLAWAIQGRASISPTTPDYEIKYPFDGFKFFCPATSTITVTAWVRKSAAPYTGGQPRLVLEGGVIAGISSDVIDTMSVGNNTWEQLSVSATPTEDCFVKVRLSVPYFDNSTAIIYIDDIGYTIT